MPGRRSPGLALFRLWIRPETNLVRSVRYPPHNVYDHTQVIYRYRECVTGCQYVLESMEL